MWIHFEQGVRWHAVLATGPGHAITFCGRYAPGDAVQREDPPARCSCCSSRIDHPYLLPVELRQKLERAKGAA